MSIDPKEQKISHPISAFTFDPLLAVGANACDPLLTVRESAALLHISVPTFWRRVADGTIPKPVKLGGLSRWPQSEIVAVIEAAKARRFA